MISLGNNAYIVAKRGNNEAFIIMTDKDNRKGFVATKMGKNQEFTKSIIMNIDSFGKFGYWEDKITDGDVPEELKKQLVELSS